MLIFYLSFDLINTFSVHKSVLVYANLSYLVRLNNPAEICCWKQPVLSNKI